MPATHSLARLGHAVPTVCLGRFCGLGPAASCVFFATGRIEANRTDVGGASAEDALVVTDQLQDERRP